MPRAAAEWIRSGSLVNDQFDSDKLTRNAATFASHLVVGLFASVSNVTKEEWPPRVPGGLIPQRMGE